MTQPRLASPKTFCRLNLSSTSVLFPLRHSCTLLLAPPPPPGLQGDSRSRGQCKSVPTPVKNKRGPGRPRKHPLPSAVSSPTCSSHATPSMSLADFLLEAGGRTEEAVPEKRGGGGGNTVQQQVLDLESQAQRKRGRKRKHGDSPCHQRWTPELVDLTVQYNHSLLLY